MQRKRLIVVFIICLIAFPGCGNDTESKSLEQGKMSMAGGDYISALNYLKLAQSEGNKNSDVRDMIDILEKYLNVKAEVEQSHFDVAAEILSTIPDSYTQYGVAMEIDKLRKEIEKEKNVSSNVDEQIAAVKKWIAEGDYASADLNIQELYTKKMNENQKKVADELKATLATVNAKIAQIEAEKETANVYDTGNTTVTATYYVVNCDESITLRTQPSTSAEEITQIPLGQAVGFIENAENGFYKINYDGQVGYGFSTYLSLEKPSINSVRYVQVVNCNEWITLRSEPSTSASPLAHIPLGTYVKYLGKASNGFYRIEYRGVKGYGLQAYLELR